MAVGLATVLILNLTCLAGEYKLCALRWLIIASASAENAFTIRLVSLRKDENNQHQYMLLLGLLDNFVCGGICSGLATLATLKIDISMSRIVVCTLKHEQPTSSPMWWRSPYE